MAEAAHEMKVVLIREWRISIVRARAPQRTTNHLRREARGRDRLGHVERNVGDSLLFGDASDGVHSEPAYSERRLVHPRKNVIELLTSAHVCERRVLEEARDAHIEDAE